LISQSRVTSALRQCASSAVWSTARRSANLLNDPISARLSVAARKSLALIALASRLPMPSLGLRKYLSAGSEASAMRGTGIRCSHSSKAASVMTILIIRARRVCACRVRRSGSGRAAHVVRSLSWFPRKGSAKAAVEIAN
jgi:hypothetical protein